MGNLHTHYDNLQVSRTASPQVIAAAYKALCIRFHPDKNLGDAQAETIMKVINRSYAVLSNPVRRAEHDAWIAGHEAERNSPQRHSHRPQDRTGDDRQETVTPEQAPSAAVNHGGRRSVVVIALLLLPGLGGITLLAASVATERNQAGTPPSSSAQMSDAFAEAFGPPAQPPVATSNGQASPAWKLDEPAPQTPDHVVWPTSANYVQGYEVRNATGLSTVRVDNSRNSTAMFVKLIEVGKPSNEPARAFYVPPNESFTLKKLSAGRYEIHYQDLSDRSYWGSEPFDVTQALDDEGTRFSEISITLYKVRNGNFDTHSLGASDF